MLADPTWTGGGTVPNLDCTLLNPTEVDNAAGHTMNMDTSSDPNLTHWYHTIDNEAGANLNISATGAGATYVDHLNNSGLTVFGILLL